MQRDNKAGADLLLLIVSRRPCCVPSTQECCCLTSTAIAHTWKRHPPKQVEEDIRLHPSVHVRCSQFAVRKSLRRSTTDSVSSHLARSAPISINYKPQCRRQTVGGPPYNYEAPCLIKTRGLGAEPPAASRDRARTKPPEVKSFLALKSPTKAAKFAVLTVSG